MGKPWHLTPLQFMQCSYPVELTASTAARPSKPGSMFDSQHSGVGPVATAWQPHSCLVRCFKSAVAPSLFISDQQRHMELLVLQEHTHPIQPAQHCHTKPLG